MEKEIKKPRGRPKIPSKDFRQVVSIRLTPKEKEKLSILAQKEELPLSEYIRNQLFIDGN